MKIPRMRTPRRSSRFAAMVGAAALVTSLAACSSGPQGTVINLYGGASASKFDEIIADCNAQAGGRYTIVGNLLPSDADGQRDQLVRRLAAKDAGMDLLGMDVTWTAEFADAGWIRELNPQQAAAATKDILQPPIDTATWKDKIYGIPKHTNVQLLWYRKDLVPTPPATFDEMMQMSQQLKDQGKPYEIGFTAAQYEGYVVNINNLIKGFGGRVVNEDSTAPAIDDKTVQALTLLNKLATSGLTSSSLSNAQEPEVFADLQAGRSAFSLNWPYVLASMKEANPDLVPNLGYAPYPKVAAGAPITTTLGGMNFASSYSRARVRRLCARSGWLTSSSLSNAQEPEVFADLQAGRSAFSLNWPYVLASMKEANPDLVPNLGYAPYPTVTAGAAHHDHAGRDELRHQQLQPAPGRGVRRGHVPALAGAPAPARDQRG